jgi:hypothetical protein
MKLYHEKELKKSPSYWEEKLDTIDNKDLRTNDLCKFRIAVIDNDNPNLKTFTHLRSFINSFDDNMSASWDSFKYLGRGEDFYTYNGFSRDFSLSFTTYARNLYAMQRMYNKKHPFHPDRNHIHHILLKRVGYLKTILII